MRSARWLFLSVCAALAVSWASGATAAICELPIAVVIANSDYEKLKLKNPRSDADEVQRAFERAGYEVRRGDQKTVSEIEALIPSSRTTPCGSTAVFYFAGHGVRMNGRTFLAGTDFRETSAGQPTRGLVDVVELGRKLAGIADRVYLFFDASRPTIDAGHNASHASLIAQFSSVPALKVVAFAAGPGQEPLDEDPTFKDNGPFARALVASIDLHWPDIDTVLLQVRQRVQRVTNGSQVPDWYRSLDATPIDRSNGR